MLKYIEVKEEIKKMLSVMKEDDLLPTYAKLAYEYNVSDITVRKALNELIKEGLIYGVRRKGVYKAKPKRTFLDVSLLTDLVYFNKNPEEDINPGLMEALQHDMIENDMDLILSLTGCDPYREAVLLQKLLVRKPYGIIANPFPTHENFDIYRNVASQFPNFVFVDKCIPGTDAHYVGTDNYNGAKKLIAELDGEKFDKVFLLHSP